MINEAVGKILGMAMAYGVSSLGLFLAYVNYRKRTMKAEKVMTTTAWIVLAVTFLGILTGVVAVARLAGTAPPPETVAAAAPEPPPPAPEPTAPAEDRGRWPLLGILLPAAIFLAATWITGALYRHFARTTQAVEPGGGSGPESRG